MPSDVVIAAELARAGAPGATLAPEIGGAVSPIHRAVENECRLAVAPGRPALFVKRLHADMRPFVDPSRSIEASRKAGEAGIAPRLVAADAAAGVLVFEALGRDWTWGRTDVLRRPATLERLLAAKRRFQGVEPLEEGRSVFDLIARYGTFAREQATALPATLPPALAAVARVAAALAAAGTDRLPCHADGAAANVMTGPGGEVRLIDFEWARATDPAHDLGTVLAELCPFDGEALLAIEMATGAASSRTLARARLFGAADDLMWALWGFILAGTSPRRHVEFAKYAEWRLLRARAVLEGPRFLPWLAMV
ncbi:MAG: phosphotransferase [Rhodobacteraceae bacterium]|nr:phosphotransferase [Paracoccaceae bacterium]